MSTSGTASPSACSLLYWLIAAISTAPLAYQLAATPVRGRDRAGRSPRWRSTGATAQGGLLAGLAYLLWLAPLQGFGGQSPVFYNLFIALRRAAGVPRAARAAAGRRSRAAVPLAMLLAGFGDHA